MITTSHNKQQLTLSTGDQNVCVNNIKPMNTGIGCLYANPNAQNNPGVFCT